MEEEGDREGGKEGERERKRRDFFLFFFKLDMESR